MEEKKSNTSLSISIVFNFLLIGSLVYAFTIHLKNKDNLKLQNSELKLGKNIKNDTTEILTSYSLMQDQYKKNISEIKSITALKNLSREINMLTDKDEKKSTRIILEIRNWTKIKSSSSVYIDDMVKQLDIQLVRLEKKPSYEIRNDIQNTISTIIFTLIDRSLIQSQRFYTFTKSVKSSIENLNN